MTKESEQSQGRYEQLLEAGGKLLSGVTGAGVGGWAGFALGGPVGAVVGSAGGAAITGVLELVGRKVAGRLSLSREEARVGGVLIVATAEILRRVEQGEKLRQDGFFDSGPLGRSDAEEAVESILLKCQREPQEKKIPYMGYLIANLAFESDTTADKAHLVIKTADELTYRQLCLLSIANQAHELDLRDSDYSHEELYLNALYMILYECLDLYRKEIIHIGPEHLGLSVDPTLGPAGVWPATMRAQGLGIVILSMMKLWLIPDEDKEPIIRLLK